MNELLFNFFQQVCWDIDCLLVLEFNHFLKKAQRSRTSSREMGQRFYIVKLCVNFIKINSSWLPFTIIHNNMVTISL